MMAAIYQELDPFPCQWLGNLIDAGHIAQGEVIPGDIRDVQAAEIEHATQVHFFAGIGVWSLALRLAGIPDGFPVWTGSCPCQPFSNAGRRKGTEDERHLFPVWRELIAKCRPPVIFGEQVASPAGRAWFGSVRLSLEALGYTVGGADLCAAGVGAPHRRQRLFFVAYAGDERCKGLCASWVHDQRERRDNDAGRCTTDGPWAGADWIHCTDGKARPTEPGTFPLADGTPARLGVLRAYGNAIVPQVAAVFIRASLEALTEPGR